MSDMDLSYMDEFESNFMLMDENTMMYDIMEVSGSTSTTADTMVLNSSSVMYNNDYDDDYTDEHEGMHHNAEILNNGIDDDGVIIPTTGITITTTDDMQEVDITEKENNHQDIDDERINCYGKMNEHFNEKYLEQLLVT